MQSVKLLGHKFLFGHMRIRRAYGITSRIKDSKDHILLFDCDSGKYLDIERYFRATYPDSSITFIKSPNGYHCIVWMRLPLASAARLLTQCPFVDLKWVGIGLKRGYWFLETRHPVGHPKGFDPVYMEIERAGNKET